MENEFKKYIVWIEDDDYGYKPTDFDSFLGAFNYGVKNSYNKQFIVTKQVYFEIKEKEEKKITSVKMPK